MMSSDAFAPSPIKRQSGISICPSQALIPMSTKGNSKGLSPPLEMGEFIVGDPDSPVSRREHLLELQSRLGEVESRLASEELNS